MTLNIIITKSLYKGVKNCALFYNADLPSKDRIPIEIIVGQASLESDWGRSRFALEGKQFIWYA